MTDTESLAESDGFVTRLPVASQAGVGIVTAPAEIDNGNIELLEEALANASTESATIVVDMTGTEFCDSSGVGVLVAAQRCARGRGGEVMLALDVSTTHRIFKLTGADRLFAVFGTVDSALAAAGRGGAA